ncbi:hypothetical protein HMPREF0083_05096 [Aneurinibacillus aneurinilyticus ATCC 12856]|uniref:Uncharacterized protein n=1 Tax=Aneurinibacillus aneurinilyticus ATCC 12856 TaxID=649747 RepID=U1Y7M1_ANEAE|nr:hypothetical protein HMPREF0083_05096 [Aneurinibacillus aneurinilyticus ATCC 12856]
MVRSTSLHLPLQQAYVMNDKGGVTYNGIRKAASKEKQLSDLFGCP